MLALGLWLGLVGCSANERTPPVSLFALTDFCAAAQRQLAGTTLPVRNVLHTDLDEFVLSKPQIEPLTMQQFARTGDDTFKGLISCKLKTADHIAAHYGDRHAGSESTCQALNRRTLQRVLDSVPSHRHRQFAVAPEKIIFEDDLGASNGPEWLAEFRAIWWEDDALHIQSKGFRADWTDPRFKGVPARFKGTHYCHAIAPDTLLSLLRAGRDG